MSVNEIRLFRIAILIVGLLPVVVAQNASGQTRTVSRGRQLAPDALEVIAPAAEWGDTFQGPVDLPLVVKNPDLAWDPNFSPVSDTLIEKAKKIIFRGDVYCLEFAFKPVRMIEIDVPSVEGVQPKTIWYLLYRVRYLGADLKPVPEPDAFNNEVYAAPQSVSAEWVRFMPTFHLDTLGMNKVYLDRVLPAAKRAIAAKERVGAKIYDSLEIQKLKIQRSTEVENHEFWGVATWVDVDPRTDFFAVRVKGLTNAQRLKLEGDQIKYLQKTLVLHFSRPGDTMAEVEDQIRFGIPALRDSDRQKYLLQQYGQEERLDHVWVYQ